MEFDYRKLKGRLAEMEITQTRLANELGMGQSGLSERFHNRAEFTRKEMLRIIEVLDIDIRDIGTYFFKVKTSESDKKKLGK